MSVTRRQWTNDSGPGNDGTILDNAELQRLYDDIDARWTIVTITSTGTQNNLSINDAAGKDADFIVFNNASDLTVTGIAAPASPAKMGKPARYICIGAGNVFFSHESGSSSAGNRIICQSTFGAPHKGANGRTANGFGTGTLVYDNDGTNPRWHVKDHEQGGPITWTPTVKFGGNQVGMTFTTQTAAYYLRGRQCQIYGRITLSAKGSSTGTATIEGFPFTSDSTTNRTSAFLTVPFFAAMATLTNLINAYIVNNSSTISVVTGGAAAVAALTDANFTNTSDLAFGGLIAVL